MLWYLFPVLGLYSAEDGRGRIAGGVVCGNKISKDETRGSGNIYLCNEKLTA